MSDTADQFADRVFASALGAIEILSIHLGDRLGMYQSLHSSPKTSAQLAADTGVAERYAREWLEQQATYGLISVDTSADDAVFTLPETHGQVLTDDRNPLYLGPLARMLATAAESMPRLLDAYRSGGGISWDAFGPAMRESQADMNRPFFDSELRHVFEGLGPVHAALSRPGASVADIGCGVGWSTLALARAYPEASFFGFDIDGPSIEIAREHAREARLDHRVTFTTEDLATDPVAGGYDAVLAFECVHDMARPVPVLTAARRMLVDDGVMVVMDEAVGETFTGSGDDIEKLMYGFSLLVCLPDGLSSSPSAGTGTVMRPATLNAYALEAGFRGFRPLTEAGFFRFYELTP